MTITRRPSGALRCTMFALTLGAGACNDDDSDPADAGHEHDATVVVVECDAGDELVEHDSGDVDAEVVGEPDGAAEDGDIMAPDGDATCEPPDAGPYVLDPTAKLILEGMSPLPALAPDPTNRVADSAAAATLGQMLYFDKAFSGPITLASDLGAAGATGKVNCASCHASAYGDDDRSSPDNISLGTGRHSRNAPPVVNSSLYKWTNWGGRFSAQWELPLVVVENAVIMNGNRLQLTHRIYDVYKAEYEAVFGALDTAIADTTRFPAAGKPNATTPGVWEAMAPADREIVNTVLVNYSKAVTAYNRLLLSGSSRFDRWVAGDEELSEQELRGAALFVGEGRCVSCHAGANFTDDEFHNIGVAQTGPNVPGSPGVSGGDEGRFANGPQLLGSAFNSAGTYSDDRTTNRLAGVTNPMPEDTRSAFRTPSLRNVAETGPYMHAGQIATLEGVVGFYNAGGGTPTTGVKDARIHALGLTDDEQAQLVAFLRTLTGEPVPAALNTDTSR